MKTKIDPNGNLVLEIGNIYDFVDTLDEEHLKSLADALSIKDYVITYIGQQILDGHTEHVSHGYFSSDHRHHTPLSKLILEISNRSGEVAAKEIERLKAYGAKIEEEKNKLISENSELRNTVYDIKRRNNG